MEASSAATIAVCQAGMRSPAVAKKAAEGAAMRKTEPRRDFQSGPGGRGGGFRKERRGRLRKERKERKERNVERRSIESPKKKEENHRTYRYSPSAEDKMQPSVITPAAMGPDGAARRGRQRRRRLRRRRRKGHRPR